jgi:uncharacterized protein YgfB (UPF0149 family)
VLRGAFSSPAHECVEDEISEMVDEIRHISQLFHEHGQDMADTGEHLN